MAHRIASSRDYYPGVGLAEIRAAWSLTDAVHANAVIDELERVAVESLE